MRLDEPPYFYRCENCNKKFSVRRKKNTISILFFKINTQKCPYCKSAKTKNIDDIIKNMQ